MSNIDTRRNVVCDGPWCTAPDVRYRTSAIPAPTAPKARLATPAAPFGLLNPYEAAPELLAAVAAAEVAEPLCEALPLAVCEAELVGPTAVLEPEESVLLGDPTNPTP